MITNKTEQGRLRIQYITRLYTTNKRSKAPPSKQQLIDIFVLSHDILTRDDLLKIGYFQNFTRVIEGASNRTKRKIKQINYSTWKIK